MQVHFGREFDYDLTRLEKLLRSWDEASKKKIFRVFRRIGVAWAAEAKKRIPVDTSMARQNIITNTSWDDDFSLTTETGTNFKDPETGEAYPVHLEFGTDQIAGGRVKALGTSPFLTDSDAIHTWPAKEADAIKKTSASYRKIDGAGARFNAKGAFVGTNPQEQMPWLRPAFNHIRDWAMREIVQAFEPPKP